MRRGGIEAGSVLLHLSPCGRGRIASLDAIRVRGYGLSIEPLTPTLSHKGRGGAPSLLWQIDLRRALPPRRLHGRDTPQQAAEQVRPRDNALSHAPHQNEIILDHVIVGTFLQDSHLSNDITEPR